MYIDDLAYVKPENRVGLPNTGDGVEIMSNIQIKSENKIKLVYVVKLLFKIIKVIKYKNIK